MNNVGVVTAVCIVPPQVRQDQAQPQPDRVRRDGVVTVTGGVFNITARNRNITVPDFTGRAFFVGPIVQGHLEAGGQVAEESFVLVVRTGAVNARHLDALQGLIILGGLEMRNRFVTALEVQGARVKPYDFLEGVDVTIGDRDVHYTFGTIRLYQNRFQVESKEGATVFLGNVSELNLVMSRLYDDHRNGGNRFILLARIAEGDLPLLAPSGDPTTEVHVGFQFIGNDEKRVRVGQTLQNSGATIQWL